MGIFDTIRRFAKGSASLPVPVAAAPSGLSAAKADFTASSDGTHQRSIWARYEVPWNLSAGGPYAHGNGSFLARERNQAKAVATDLSTSDPTLATITLNGTTHAVGTGLTLSSKLDAKALGITPEQARELAGQLERAWKRYAESPDEVDVTGRHDLHQLVAGAYDHWQRTGEVLIGMEWRRAANARFRTRVNLLDPDLLDVRKTITGPGPGEYTYQGVVFDANGKVRGYFIYDATIGHPLKNPISKFVPATTSWGRTRIFHRFQLQAPGQARGLSPLTPALTPSKAKDTLGEFTLDAALVQTQYAATVESELPPQSALGALRTDDGLSTGTPGAAAGGVDPLEMRAHWYGQNKIAMKPGVVNALPTGDKLRIHRSETPNSTFESFDRSITRSAAKAAGSSFEDISGDFSQTSFSASRLATETPHRIIMRRRRDIVEAIYKMVFACWLEEAIETNAIKLPRNAPDFYVARDLYTEAKWLGQGRVVADPLKAAQATALELEEGLTTKSDALAERGLDFETVLEERKAEREAEIAAGFSPDRPKTPTSRTPQPDDEGEGDQPQPTKPQRKNGR